MEFGQNKFSCEIHLFDFTNFFWPGLFKIFWPTILCEVMTKKNLLDDVVDAIFVVVAVVVQQLQPKLPKNFVTKVVLRLDSV